MKFLKSSLVYLLFLFACPVAFSMDMKGFYSSLNGREEAVLFRDSEGHILLGVSTFEKSEGNVICRKIAPVIPRPNFTITCYVGMSGIDATALYINTAGEARKLDRNSDEPGKIIFEKNGEGYLCQSIELRRENQGVKCYTSIKLLGSQFLPPAESL